MTNTELTAIAVKFVEEYIPDNSLVGIAEPAMRFIKTDCIQVPKRVTAAEYREAIRAMGEKQSTDAAAFKVELARKIAQLLIDSRNAFRARYKADDSVDQAKAEAELGATSNISL